MNNDIELQDRDQDLPGFFLNPPPAPRNPSQQIEATPFAGPYRSIFTVTGPPSPQVMNCLKHVNCSYLSSNGLAPTSRLKKHAQSLAVLIKEMTVSTMPGLIDNAHAGLPGARPFHENESYDWLNDLSVPYDTEEEHHHMPLTSLVNTLEPASGTHGQIRNICPLHSVDAAPPTGQTLPFATHAALIQHANKILERLDHEYSAKGGLLSIFPTEMEKEDREKAEKTVLGQMILWIQNLVQRIHHLERLYANSMDLLAKEAVIPTETLSALGTRGRKGREVVYPQDKFVLVNAGDDLWQFLNAEFERKEVIDVEVDKSYRKLGVTGEAIWAQRGGREFAKGITCIDVYTRYYRLRDNPLKTIFVIPAWESHPGVKVTRDMDRQPTVVSVVKPVWPERMTVREMEHRSDMEDLRRLKIEAMQKDNDIAFLQEEQTLLRADRELKDAELRDATRRGEEFLNALKQPANQTKLAVFEKIAKAAEAREEAVRMRASYEKQIEETKKDREEAALKSREMKQ